MNANQRTARRDQRLAPPSSRRFPALIFVASVVLVAGGCARDHTQRFSRQSGDRLGEEILRERPRGEIPAYREVPLRHIPKPYQTHTAITSDFRWQSGIQHHQVGDHSSDDDSHFGGGQDWPHSSPEKQPPRRSRVIAFLPVSGRFATMGQSVERGFRCGLAVGDDSTEVDVSVLDAGIEGDAPMRELEAVLSNQPAPEAIIGPFLSSQVAEVASLASENRVPVFNLSKATAARDGSVLDLGFSLPTQLRGLVSDGIVRAGVTRLAIARTQTPFSDEIVQEFRRSLEGSGVSVLFEGSYGEGGEFEGVEGVVKRLEELPIQGIFVADTVQGASRLLSSMGSSLRRRISVFGPGAWFNAAALRATQEAFSGAIFPVPYIPDNRNPYSSVFNRCLSAKRHRGEDFLSALGFDVGTIIAGRWRGLGGHDREFKGLTGTFVLEGTHVRRTVAIGTFKEGVVYSFNPVIRSLDDVLS